MAIELDRNVAISFDLGHDLDFLSDVFNQLYVRNEMADYKETKMHLSIECEASDVSWIWLMVMGSACHQLVK